MHAPRVAALVRARGLENAMIMKTRWIAACVPLCAAAAVAADPPDASLDEIIVTASRMHAPLLVITDPRAPRQPVPANDGADYLKTIPGFNVIRKGGTDGDPVFRGMAASRVNILSGGEQVLGGCGLRMDPPTAYVFPEAYDRITVVKGPQSVQYGAGGSAATVRFESSTPTFEQGNLRGRGSALGASFARQDYVIDLQGGGSRGYAQFTGTWASSDDYEDGAGQSVNSAYERWSTRASFGLRLGEKSLVELSGTLSDGEAAYADRAMDGVMFDRQNLGLKFELDSPAEWLQSLEAQAYYNYVDHVMDNYSLRDFQATPMMPNPAAQNPDRLTTGGRLALEFTAADDWSGTAGLDLQENQHRLRASMNQDLVPYQSLTRSDDAWFRNLGAFAELTWEAQEQTTLVGGLRADRWQARDQRETLPIGMSRVPNPTADQQRDQTLTSGFLRIERGLRQRPATLFVGLGHAQRFPDFWELISQNKESVDSLSAFNTRPEKTTQLDAGFVLNGSRLSGSVSLFYSDLRDYVLIESGYPKGARRTIVTRNVDANTWGGEADIGYIWSDHWRMAATLAYTRGENETDSRPLAQMPPLELRSSLDYQSERWTAGLLWRLVAEQDRYAISQGNVVGQDLGRTGGFGVLSLNGGWRPHPSILLTAGVDNVFDKLYAEHLSRGGAAVAGYEQTERVNEPGRTFWLKLNAGVE
jgi:iron complex outermembrane receptor protein